MRRRSECGFTLIEVLAALLIAAVALTYLLQSETASIRISNAARDLREATMLVAAKLEEIAVGAEGETSGSFEDRPDWSWESTREPVSEPFAMTKVIVTVAYRSAGRDQTVSLERIRMRRCAAGFTLLEVLLTIAITALFSSGVYAVFLRSLVDTRWVQESTAAGRLGQSIMALLARDLASCLPELADAPHFTGSVGTEGMSRLEFLAAADSRWARDGAPSDLIRVAYETRPNEEAAGVLKLYRVEEYGAGRTVDAESRLVLLSGAVTSFAVEYFDGTDWRDTWAEAGLPRAARAALVLTRRLQTNPSAEANDRTFAFTATFAIPAGAAPAGTAPAAEPSAAETPAGAGPAADTPEGARPRGGGPRANRPTGEGPGGGGTAADRRSPER